MLTEEKTMKTESNAEIFSYNATYTLMVLDLWGPQQILKWPLQICLGYRVATDQCPSNSPDFPGYSSGYG